MGKSQKGRQRLTEIDLPQMRSPSQPWTAGRKGRQRMVRRQPLPVQEPNEQGLKESCSVAAAETCLPLGGPFPSEHMLGGDPCWPDPGAHHINSQAMWHICCCTNCISVLVHLFAVCSTDSTGPHHTTSLGVCVLTKGCF